MRDIHCRGRFRRRQRQNGPRQNYSGHSSAAGQDPQCGKGSHGSYIFEIEKIDKKRAFEVSSFYFDLEASIKSLINSINIKGLSFFVVGNRRVKNIELPTDKFIAQLFEENNFNHITTIERKISNKAMPIRNSPTNKIGILSNTINKEYIIVCQKNK